MLHPIHTPLHCQHQANTAYDKLAVISDNMPKIQEVEQFIFELRQWLRAYLEGIKSDFDQALQDLLTGDNIWEGNNTYIKDITLRDGDIYWKDANGNNLAWVTYDAEHQILTFHAGGKEIQLSADGSIAPTTNPDLTTAIVTLDYLNRVLEGYLSALTFDDTPTDGSTNPVTSDGIYEALQDVIAMIPDELTIDDAVTEESENPVTSSGIYTFVTGLLGNIPNPEQYILPHASDERLGGIKVGDYLTINANGVLSVDIDAIKYSLGLTSFDDENIGYVSASFDQLFSGAPSGSDVTAWSSSNTSLLGDCIGAGNSFLEPQILITVANNGEYNRIKNFGTTGNSIIKHAVNIATRFYCTNKTTQVVKSYVPLRTVIIYNGVRHSNGGTEMGGTYWQNVEIRAWYKAYNYSLTAEDISAVNADANAFAASLQLGYDTGEFGVIA